MIFYDLDTASYNKVMELFRVWLKEYDIDALDPVVRQGIEHLVDGLFDSIGVPDKIREEIWEELHDEVWDDVRKELRSEIEDEVREELEEKQDEED